jgi:hypothetical protein
MFPILFGLGAIAGLVGYAIRRATGPSTKPLDERYKLERLKMRKVLTLDEAEDGLVLARRYGDRKAQLRFQIEVIRLRKLRPPV